jgi:hypothetical protein
VIARRLSCALLIAVLVCHGRVGRAAAPVLDNIYPAGAQRGTTATINASGKFDPWPVQAWSDSPEIKLEPAATSGTFTIKISDKASLGPHLIRVFNSEGASNLRLFFIGPQPEAAESEPNDDLSKIKTLQPLPITLNGQLEKPGDVDAFAFHLEAGQTLVASLHGRRLGSLMDPMLHLFDEAGHELAFAHDGFGLDPLLFHPARSTGTYIIRVSAFAFPPAADVKLTGGKNCIYRLSLTTGPFIRATSPAGMQRGQKKSVQLLGWNLPTNPTQEIDATKIRSSQDHLFIPTQDGETRFRIDIGEGPELMEDQAKSTLSPPFAINARISAANEEDRYEFAAKKDQKLTIALRAGTLGSPLDALLRLEDSTGKELLRSDDTVGDDDIKIDWNPPADGTYRAIVSDMKRQGGKDHLYRVSAQKPSPAISATVSAQEFRVMPGKTVAIKITSTRLNGHQAPLVALAADLSPGLTSTTAPIPEKSGEIEITLTASPTAKPASVPIRLMLLSTDPENASAQPAIFDLSKEANTQQLIASTDSIWLTVLTPPPTTLPTTQPTTKPTTQPKPAAK